MSNIPAWAALIYGLMEAPKMAKGVTDVWQGINDLRYGANFNEDTNSLFNAKNPQEIRNLQPQSMSPDQRKEFETLRQFQLGKKYEEEAAPLLQAINDFNTNPNFQDYESRQVVAQDPMGAISNPGSADRQMLQNNPKAKDALQRFQQQNSNVLRFTDADRSLTGQITDPMQAATARGWSQTIEPEHLAARTNQTELALKTQATNAQSTRNQGFASDMQKMPQGLSWDDQMKYVTGAVTKWQPDHNYATNVLTGYKDVKPEFAEMTLGTGEVDETQPALVEKRTQQVSNIGPVRRESPRGTSVNVGVNAYESEINKMMAKDVMNMREAAKASRTKLDSLDAIEMLSGDLKTGKLTDLGISTAQLGESFGLRLDPNLPAKEAARAIMGRLALEARNPSGGAGMPGAMSDSDRQFLVSTITPSLAQSQPGRKMLINTMRSLEQRGLDVSNKAEMYIKKYGKLDDGFYQQLNIWSRNNPLFQRRR